jgi:hypothetical protein
VWLGRQQLFDWSRGHFIGQRRLYIRKRRFDRERWIQ